MLAAMAFGFHPVYLIVVLLLLLILGGAAYLLGWAFRKGWDAAGPPARPPAAPPPGP